MSSEQISIRVNDLSKRFEIYAHPVDRLKQMVLPRVRHMLHQSGRAYFREFWALRNVGFDVRKGETIGVVGRNGSGKSTLLQLICGTLTPTTGAIDVRGRIAALLELGSGFNPEFTGRENVYLNAAVLGLTREEIDERYGAIVAFADIGDFVEQPVKTYSSGMYVRLAFAVAINVSPDILVVDEALSVGDEAFQRKCFARIDAIRDAGATVLFVSHAAGKVIELCDRAILLDAGELLADGRPKRVVTSYQRLLYAPSEQRHHMRAALLRYGSAAEEVDGDESDYSDDSHALSNEGHGLLDVGGVGAQDDERYDPELRPKSTVRYESHGVHIHDVRLVNSAGQQVNVLVPGREYAYQYTVDFVDSATNVSFGMMLKSITGLELFGMSSHAEGCAIPIVDRGQRFEVKFRFESRLMPGTYFTNAGCNGCSHAGQFGFLDRVVDAVMFRIESRVGVRVKAGFYDLAAEPACRIISTSTATVARA